MNSAGTCACPTRPGADRQAVLMPNGGASSRKPARFRQWLRTHHTAPAIMLCVLSCVAVSCARRDNVPGMDLMAVRYFDSVGELKKQFSVDQEGISLQEITSSTNQWAIVCSQPSSGLGRRFILSYVESDRDYWVLRAVFHLPRSGIVTIAECSPPAGGILIKCDGSTIGTVYPLAMD